MQIQISYQMLGVILTLGSFLALMYGWCGHCCTREDCRWRGFGKKLRKNIWLFIIVFISSILIFGFCLMLKSTVLTSIKAFVLVYFVGTIITAFVVAEKK